MEKREWALPHRLPNHKRLKPKSHSSEEKSMKRFFLLSSIVFSLHSSPQPALAAPQTLRSCLSDWLEKTALPWAHPTFTADVGKLSKPNINLWPRAVQAKIDQADLHLLGKGQAGSVYRVTPKDGGAPWILKISEDGFEDYFKMHLLRQACQEPPPCALKIPWTDYLGKDRTRGLHFIATENLEGRTLHKLLLDYKILPSKKRELRAAYKKALEDLTRVFEHYNPIEKPPIPEYFVSQHSKETHVPLDGLPIWGFRFNPTIEALFLKDQRVPIPEELMKNFQIQTTLIKSDNILVDAKTHKLILIDPF